MMITDKFHNLLPNHKAPQGAFNLETQKRGVYGGCLTTCSITKDPKMQQPIGKQKPIRRPPQRPPPQPSSDCLFNFDNDIFQTENESLGKFKIINIHNSQNKKFKSFTNEFELSENLKKKLDDVKEIYHIFQELIKTVKGGRKLSNNDRLRFVIHNEELPNAISTKFSKVKDFKLGDLEQVIKILKYRDILPEN